MNKFAHLRLICAGLFLAVAFSAALPISALADDGTPPTEPTPPAGEAPTEEAPVEEAPAVDPTEETLATEEAVAQEPSVAVEDPAPLEQEPALLTELPQGTEVVVLDDQGEAISLASEDAAEILMDGDPIWCPLGVTPVANMGGCSGSYTTFAALFADPIFTNGGGVGPAMKGVIWVRDNYLAADSSGITIDGGSLTTMRNFSLAVRGGWTGVTTTINQAAPSAFDVSLTITDWNADVTLSDLVFTGAAGSPVLQVNTTKNITVTRVDVISNPVAALGANLSNSSGTGNVTVSSSKFNSNGSTGGLAISSNGTITLTSVIANNNTGYGASLNASGALKTVTLNNSEFNTNGKEGLTVSSIGPIAASNLTGSDNGQGAVFGGGATLDNCVFTVSCTGSGNVTLTGTNIFLNNYETGLFIYSNGVINASNLYASSNGTGGSGYGAWLNSAGSNAAMAVNLTGSNEFKDNDDQGLRIQSKGAVTLSNLIASLNGSIGAEIDNTYLGSGANAVALTGTNVFYNNASYGLGISSLGAISVSNVTANSNALGASLNNSTSAAPQNVTVSGINNFSNNTASGLYVQSRGIITVNSVTASDNGSGYGAYLYNNNGVNNLMKGINVTGTNIFNNNNLAGLTTGSFGPITINNVTANNTANGLGIQLYNLLAATPQAITVTGTNTASGNTYNGINVVTRGAIKINSLTANLNGITGFSGNGATLDNSTGVAASTITLTGTNLFNNNYDGGLILSAAGAISLSNITASGNTQNVGANIGNTALGAATPQNVTLTGTNTFSNNYLSGLEVYSNGMITASNLNAINNGNSSSSGYGVYLLNNTATTAKSVILTGTNVFNSNYREGLYIVSKGAITASNVTANSSTSEDGAVFSNDTAGSPQNVTLSGINHFESNVRSGLEIVSVGAITISNVTSISNGFVSGTGYGAYLHNQTSVLPQNVTISGTNIFSSNRTYGLDVQTKGAITGNNITASGNVNGYGAKLDNAEGLTTSAKAVTLTGTNVFSSNVGAGLQVDSYGPISINSVTANSNTTGFGTALDNSGATVVPQKVAITGTNTFNSNPGGGLSVTTLGLITANNITASSSASNYGAQFVNNSSVLVQPVTLTGTNVFSSNFSYGLQIYSKGAITVNNVTASFNANGVGANLVNAFGLNTSAQPVKITGTNVFNNDYLGGLAVSSYGAITGNNITANSATTTDGVSLNNSTAAGPQAVTFTGTNYFASNDGTGLTILTAGTISLSNIHADGNGTDGTGDGASLDNSSATPLTQNVTISGTNTFSNNGDSGLVVTSKGVITLSNTMASGNQDYGADLENITGAVFNLAKGVTLTGTNQFSSNASADGLRIFSYGPVSVSAVTANLNGAYGANISNTGATNSQNVVITGINTFNQNTLSGLNVNTKGAITSATSIVANSNADGGAVLNNTAGSSAAVTLSGINTFSGNSTGDGLEIVSVGAVTLNNVTASLNGNTMGDYGVYVNNTFATTPLNVTLSGVNTFSDNYDSGLSVTTEGAISLNSVTANNNSSTPGFYGVVLDNTATEAKTVTITGTNTFNGNGATGLQIWSKGAVTLNSITASGNSGSGADIQNYTAAALQFVKLNGTNVFTGNTDTGLQVTSKGAITANNLTASNNLNGGTLLDNDEVGATAASTITLTGVHFFNENTNLGLRVRSASTVTLSKLTADDNSNDGVEIDTAGAVTLACASITSNGAYGIDIVNAASLTLKGVISSGNTSGDLNFVGTLIIVRSC